MLILALDTTTRAGSAAVVRDGGIVAELSGEPARTHGERLPGDLIRVLEQAGAAIGDIDRFAVAAGPGSFTGLRVGIATIQGLAVATGRAVVPVSVLDALARAGADGEHPVGAWMDAQRGEVFAALYDAGGHPILEPAAAAPAATLDAWRSIVDLSRVVFAGDGAVRYADVLAQAIASPPAIVPPPPLAGLIGRIAFEHPERAVVPHAIAPIYVRRSDAELARARRAAAEGRG